MYATNITDLPTLYSYEKALRHYESIKPIRGSNNLRPICATKNGRRKKHMQIIKRKDAIACRLYDTDVLTFYKDGVVEYHSGTWISNSTHSFANGILYPYVNFGTRLGNTEVWIKAQTYYVSPKQTFKMKRTGEPHQPPEYTAINPPKNFEYYLKRKEYNAKRKQLKKFQDHCIRMSKLADPKESQTVARIREVIHAGRKPRQNCRLIYDAICAGDGGTTVAHMLEEIRDYTYTDVAAGGWEYVYHFDLDQLKDIISDIVKYAFADELFEKIETVKRTFNGNNLYIKEYEE